MDGCGTENIVPDGFTIPVDSNKELRCPKCDRLLLKGCVAQGTAIEVKCPRCKILCRIAYM